MRALQLYAPKAGRGNYDRAFQLAASWLAKARAFTNEDRAWHLAGLAWAGTDTAATRKAMNEVLATQRPDGGWSDLPTTQSTAYATGKILVALQLAGMPVSDLSYKRGLKFLLSTQQEDGSWYVKTRALAFQPWFDAGFPHGYDQWISAAATSWAAMALTFALPETGLTVASRVQ
jgi:squalene cyclase